MDNHICRSERYGCGQGRHSRHAGTGLAHFSHLAVIGLLFLGLAAGGVRAESSLTLSFDRSKATINSASGDFEYAGYQTLSLPSGVRLAIETALLKINGLEDGASPQLTLGATSRTLVGEVDPQLLSLTDIPTADDARYHDIKPAVASLFEDGFSGVSFAGLARFNGETYARLTISPFQVDSSGAVYFLSGLSAQLAGASASLSGEALVGDQTRNIAQTSGGTSMSANRMTGASLVDYVVITNSTLADEFSKLVEYKNSTGIHTELVLIEDILAVFGGVDNAEALREYLKTFYATGGKYVLLAGDETVIPIRRTYYYNTFSQPPVENLMVSDLYFADLNGIWDVDGDGVWGEPLHDSPDLTPELAVGRLPLSRPEQARAYVDKLILYETNPGFGDMSYLERSVIFSSDQMRDFGDGGQHAILANAMPGFVEVDTADIIETPTGSDAAPFNFNGQSSIDKVQDGYGIVNVIAHGRHDGFVVRTAQYNEWPKSYIVSTDEVGGHGSTDSLKENGKIGLYVALSCDIGGFDMDSPPFITTSPSLVESLIAKDSAGAVGMVAYTRWGWVYSSYNLHRAFLEALYGAAEGSPVVAMNMAAEEYPYYRDLIYGQNYFGDPTLRIHTHVPAKYDLAIEFDQWAQGMALARVTNSGAPVANARVLVSDGGEIVSDGLTDSEGFVALGAEYSLGREYRFVLLADSALVSRVSLTPGLSADVDTDGETALPLTFALRQNYPNPFNPSSTIPWDQPARSSVTLQIYDILGRTVTNRNLGEFSAGSHSVVWDGVSDDGAGVASGIYFYRITAGAHSATRKMTLLK